MKTFILYIASIYFLLCYLSRLISACRDVEFVEREAWGAKLSLQNDTMNMPAQHIFIHHTAGATCNDKPSCSRVMRSIQDYHMDTLGWDDIGYNFLIGGDGRVYVGRNWTRIGAHTYGFNRVSIAFSLMGNFVDAIPNDVMLGTTGRMIVCAREEEYVTNTTKIHGHRDGGCTQCPGEALYEIIKHWPDFEAGPLKGKLC